MSRSLGRLASLTTECATPEEYDLARAEWLHAAVDCDTIYQGAVTPAQAVAPLVSGVDAEYTAHCEAIADRYWPDRQRLNLAAREAGGIVFDTEALPARERRERVFYREIVAGLQLRTIAVAVRELRGEPVSCIYFGWTSRQTRRELELELVRAALPLLALGDAPAVGRHDSARTPPAEEVCRGRSRVCSRDQYQFTACEWPHALQGVP